MMARSRAIDWLRSSGAQARREQTAYELEVSRAEMPTAPREIESAEQRERVGDALGALPTEQRDCIRLAFFDGLSHAQVAARLGQPLGTVKSRILLGMNKMREALRD
jgi:RNA polymerase sigma-70 factor (ECF subfamily)